MSNYWHYFFAHSQRKRWAVERVSSVELWELALLFQRRSSQLAAENVLSQNLLTLGSRQSGLTTVLRRLRGDCEIWPVWVVTSPVWPREAF